VLDRLLLSQKIIAGGNYDNRDWSQAQSDPKETFGIIDTN